LAPTCDRFDDCTDQDLLRIAVADPEAERSRRAASVLLKRHADRVFAWCFRCVRDHERALDLSQEVLLLAYRDLPTFQGRSRFSSWLYTVTRHRCLRELRRPALLVDEDADPDTRASDRPPPDIELEERLDEAQVLDLIHQHLAPVEQEALRLRCYERLPVETITEILGITEVSGARGVLQQARRKLRAALEQRHRREGVDR